MEVTVGKESLQFESGPFSHFGSCALTAGGVFALGDELGEQIEKREELVDIIYYYYYSIKKCAADR